MINKLSIQILVILFLFSCGTMEDNSKYGHVNLDKIKSYDWFLNEYDSYKIKGELIDLRRIDGIKIKVFLGDWCEDSHEQVPRFLKVLDSCHYSINNIDFVNVNMTKDNPKELIEEFNVKYVPTIFIYQNGELLKKIVETPNESFESELRVLFK